MSIPVSALGTIQQPCFQQAVDGSQGTSKVKIETLSLASTGLAARCWWLLLHQEVRQAIKSRCYARPLNCITYSFSFHAGLSKTGTQ